jgi:hypothetical protein
MTVQERLLRVWLAGRALGETARAVTRRSEPESGEGVISTAIAVLIMALIGLAMWRLFNTVFTDAGNDIQQNVNEIGS